ncbi:unnamed protein product, partial [Rhizoctonia solani]
TLVLGSETIQFVNSGDLLAQVRSEMLLTRVAQALSLVLALHIPQAGASPLNVDVTARGIYSQKSNTSNSNGGVIVAIVAAAAVGMIVGCVVLYRQHRRHERERGTSATQQTSRDNYRIADRTPTRRTTCDYIGITERTGNARVETWGADRRIDDTSTPSVRQTRENRRPTQNPDPSLPAYNEQAPTGEVVLLERVQSMSDDENGGIGNEAGNTPTNSAVPPYTISSPTPESPGVMMNAINGPRRSRTRSVGSLQDQLENPGSEATTIPSSINITGSEHTNARIPIDGTTKAPANTTAPSDENVPSYEEGTVTVTGLTTSAGATKALNTPAQGEQRR